MMDKLVARILRRTWAGSLWFGNGCITSAGSLRFRFHLCKPAGFEPMTMLEPTSSRMQRITAMRMMMAMEMTVM